LPWQGRALVIEMAGTSPAMTNISEHDDGEESN
jgi:hypothetical protein